MSEQSRQYPLRKPEGHVPPVPRWHLTFEPGTTHVYTTYIGLQQHDQADSTTAAAQQAKRAITACNLETSHHHYPHIEEFDLIPEDGEAVAAHVWVLYWSDEGAYKDHTHRLSIDSIHASLPGISRSSIGIWRESFSIPVTRLETNYSGLDYLPGFAKLPGTKTEAHNLTAYWGAARDRIADSAQDLFPIDDTVPSPNTPPVKLGQHLKGTNSAKNIVFIRTGQFWENCDEVESRAYEKKLEPTLEAGLRYLRSNPSATGAMGLRYLRNTDLSHDTSDRGETANEQVKKRETCVTGFFASLDRLEDWAKNYKSHLAIYNGAMKHAKDFGPDRKFRTWHEVVVLKKGEAEFEYVKCVEGTGLMSFFPMEVK